MKSRIKRRILKAFLSVSLAALVLTMLVCGINLQLMNGQMEKSIQSIGEQSAQSSETLLINQALTDSSQFVSDKAEIVTRQLVEIATVLKSMGTFTQSLYENARQYQPSPILTAEGVVQAGQADGMSLQYALNPGIRFEDVKDELYLQGNLLPLFEAVTGSHPTITSIYTASASGFTVGYDENAREKAELGMYYETRESDWYVKARDSGEIYVSDAYPDSFGRGLTVTMSIPFEKDGAFAGVIGLDIQIDKMNQDILEMEIGKWGYAMLFSPNGTVISAPGVTDENADNLFRFLGRRWEEIARLMQTEQSGIEQSRIEGSDVYILFERIELTGWSFAVVLPVHEIVAPAREATEAIETITAAARQEIDRYILITNLSLAVLFCVVTAALVLVTLNVAGKITRPVIKLTQDVKKIGEGNLTYVSGIHTKDEIEVLSKAFEQMTGSLREYIDNLSRVTAEKERIGAELDVATDIQASMLPCIFPAFPDREEFDIYATMQPAKEVGGDFYDFFLIDGDHLAVVMADVSGKGVPAALFMVIAKTLIKNHAQAGESPADVFTNTNRQLCENNEAGMFVTAWMGVLEISTGKFTYVNAGHNPPLLKRADGNFEYLKSRAGFVLAGMEEIRYRQQEMELRAGDVLYLYTDGVTEAADPDNRLYGDARLRDTLNKHASLPPSELLAAVKEDLDRFAKGAAQFDDITMLALKIKEEQT